MTQPDSSRNRLFWGLFLFLVLGTAAVGIFVAQRSRTERAQSASGTNGVSVAGTDSESRKGTIYYRTNSLGPNYGKLTAQSLDAPEQIRYSGLTCDRVYFAGGNGVCLTAERGIFTKYHAVAFDEQLMPRWKIPLNGLPSRVRISSNGRLAAITVFISGHAYTSGGFSTQTLILDAGSGKVMADVEEFSVTHENKAFKSADFNFWGVTFQRNENRFYATLSTAGKAYLVEGDLIQRSATVIHEGVECPSVSPDNSRVAFKKRTGSLSWRIAVLDLKTLIEMPLGESRSVDDQVEWLDDDHVLYALPQNEGSTPSSDIWSVATRAEATPTILRKGASSPAVSR